MRKQLNKALHAQSFGLPYEAFKQNPQQDMNHFVYSHILNLLLSLHVYCYISCTAEAIELKGSYKA